VPGAARICSSVGAPCRSVDSFEEGEQDRLDQPTPLEREI